MQIMHECGGTVLVGCCGTEQEHLYCDRCGAFTHNPEHIANNYLPSGTDKVANRAAFDEGEESSPEESDA